MQIVVLHSIFIRNIALPFFRGIFYYTESTIKMDLLREVSNELVDKKEWPEFQAGDTITVYYDIKEGETILVF